MGRMEEQVEKFIEKYSMIHPGDRILLGLSGGADSVCLLFLLKELRGKIPFSLAAVHVNHNLRGREALEDQQFSEKLCREQGIPCFPVSVRVEEIACREKISLEEAGRKARYKTFEAICRKEGYKKIALAHHQDDLAETMIYHLARGTGLGGMCSPRPVSGNRIRPLLCVGRTEIEEWLRGKGLTWRTDSSNLEDHFTRNKIRHHVMDYLIGEINPRAAVHMAAVARELWQLEALKEELAVQRLEQLADKREGGTFLKEEFAAQPEVLRHKMLHLVIGQEAGSLKDITRTHVEAADSLWKKQTGKSICLPGGLRAVREYQGIRIGRKKEEIPEDIQELQLQVPGTVQWGTYEITCRILEGEFGQIEEKAYTKWLDYDKINPCLKIRHRKAGDRFAVHPLGGKKLKDYLIDCKIPREERERLWLLADGGEILWIVGGRISEAYKVKRETQKALYIQIKGGTIHE